MLDTNEVREMEKPHLINARALAKVVQTLDWYHATLNLALAEIDRLKMEYRNPHPAVENR